MPWISYWDEIMGLKDDELYDCQYPPGDCERCPITDCSLKIEEADD